MDYFDDQPDLYGEPPLYADALALPVPPPPEPVGIGPPTPASPFEAAQYLPPPPPPDAGIAAFPLGEQDASPVPAELPPSFAPPPPVTTLPSLAAPPLPASPVDAVTAAAPLPAQAQQVRDTEQRYFDTVQQYADDPFAIPDLAQQQRYLNELALRNPAKFADIQLQHEDARLKEDAARRQKIANDNYEQQRANQRAVAESRAKIQQQTDQVMAEAQRLYDEKIDPTGGLDTGQKIAGVLSSIVGGLVQGRTGAARNAGLDSFNDLVNRGIEAQKATLANRRSMLEFKRSALGQAYERTGDMFVAAESVRQAAYTHAIGMLDADMQNWDPRGTQGLRRASLRAKILTERAQSLHKFQNEQEDRDLKQREQKRKEEETRAQIAKTKAETAKLYADASAQRADKQTWTPDQLGVLNPGLPKPPISMTQADYTKWLGTQKSGEEYKTAARANDPNERARELSVPGVTDDTGQPILFQNTTEATTVKKAHINGSNMLRKVDQLIQMIHDHGHESDFGKSKAWQQMQQIHASLTLDSKKMDELGALTGSDIDLEHKKIGTSDPTQVRNTIPGLEAFRNDIIQGVNSIQQNTAVVGPGRKVADWTPPPLDLKPHEQSVDEIQIERLRQDPYRDDTARRELAAAEQAAQQNRTPETVAALKRAHENASEATQWQRDKIATLGALAAGPADDPEAKKAREILDNTVTTGETATLRRLAKLALESAARAGVSTEDTTMGVR